MAELDYISDRIIKEREENKEEEEIEKLIPEIDNKFRGWTRDKVMAHIYAEFLLHKRKEEL